MTLETLQSILEKVGADLDQSNKVSNRDWRHDWKAVCRVYMSIDLVNISDLDTVKDDMIEKVVPTITFDFSFGLMS